MGPRRGLGLVAADVRFDASAGDASAGNALAYAAASGDAVAAGGDAAASGSADAACAGYVATAGDAAAVATSGDAASVRDASVSAAAAAAAAASADACSVRDAAAAGHAAAAANGFLLAMERLSGLTLLLSSARTFLSAANVSVQRGHLMLWAVFAPKFVFDATMQAVTGAAAVAAWAVVLAAHRAWVASQQRQRQQQQQQQQWQHWGGHAPGGEFDSGGCREAQPDGGREGGFAGQGRGGGWGGGGGRGGGQERGSASREKGYDREVAPSMRLRRAFS